MARKPEGLHLSYTWWKQYTESPEAYKWHLHKCCYFAQKGFKCDQKPEKGKLFKGQSPKYALAGTRNLITHSSIDGVEKGTKIIFWLLSLRRKWQPELIKNTHNYSQMLSDPDLCLANTVTKHGFIFLTTGCVSKCEAKKTKTQGLFRATIILINTRKFNWRQPGTTFVIQVLHKTSTVNFQLYHIATLMPTKQLNSWLKKLNPFNGYCQILCSRCSRGDTAWPYCTTVSASNEAKE